MLVHLDSSEIARGHHQLGHAGTGDVVPTLSAAVAGDDHLVFAEGPLSDRTNLRLELVVALDDLLDVALGHVLDAEAICRRHGCTRCGS